MTVTAIDLGTDAAVNGEANGRVTHLYVGAVNNTVYTLLTETARRAYLQSRELIAAGTPETDEHVMALQLVAAGGTFSFAGHDDAPSSFSRLVCGTVEEMRAWTVGIKLVDFPHDNSVPFGGANPLDDMDYVRTFAEVAATFGFVLNR